ncbi:MAG: M23 family metallopeptidase, partial [Bacteroidia bacterium]|nr:M23 family metallopeptidase [Bacteroidia bacterium]
MMALKFLLAIHFIFFITCLSAQPVSYPKNYFRNPLDIPMQLSANFGEPRSDHWHMGLDIRTRQRENLQVHAAAGGYIAHVGVRPQSFGKFIVVNHPNGYSTLYAHLNDFFPALEKYVTAQQYQQETWEIELDFAKEKFPVIKGQLIAYSGNTGGSQGPHLHFEIRDTKTDRCLNPLFFGFPVQDNVPPNIVKLAMYDRSISVYEQTPLLLLVKNTGNGYIIPSIPVIKTGLNKISFAIQAYDRTTGLKNPNGIYSAHLFIDDKAIIGFALDSIDYNETAYINAHIDYKYRNDGGAYLQYLFQLPGDHGMVYEKAGGDGKIDLQDTAVHNVRIEIKDTYLNNSVLNFAIQHSDSIGNTIKPANTNNSNQRFIPNQVNVLERQDFEMYLPEICLYDTIQALYSRTNSSLQNAVTALHQVNDASVPVHDNLTVRIKPDKPVPEEWKNKIVIKRTSGESSSIRKAEWQGNGMANDKWLSA